MHLLCGGKEGSLYPMCAPWDTKNLVGFGNAGYLPSSKRAVTGTHNVSVLIW